MSVYNGKVVLRGGTIVENKGHGVEATGRGKITVAKAEKDTPQTVCKDNGKDNAGHDWRQFGEGSKNWSTSDSSEIIGIPQEKINVCSMSRSSPKTL